MPDIYITDPEQTTLVVPMERPPEWQEIHHGKPSKVFLDTFAPLAVGALVPVREEWRLLDFTLLRSERKYKFTIQYRDGRLMDYFCIMQKFGLYVSSFVKSEEFTKGNDGDWQPASTMPDFAVREHRRVCAVEATELIEGEPGHEFREWLWLITLGDTVYRDDNGVKARRVSE